MSTNPWSEPSRLAWLQASLKKHQQRPRTVVEATLRGHLKAAAFLGLKTAPPARILDVGCGIGDSVQILAEQGFDAYGIDILEYWNRNFDQFWEERPKPAGAHLARLHVVDLNAYRIPFPDAHFDFAFSDEVFEHVFDYETMFREIARVLRPGAISLHCFPGLSHPMEGHINIPFPGLCYSKAYLTLWALTGRRSERQLGFGWRKTLSSNLEMMRYCNYPTKARLRSIARACSVALDFVEPVGLLTREHGRVANLIARVPRFLQPIAASVISLVSQRYMLIARLP